MSRFARRTDDNLAEIVKAYRKLGAVVHVTNGAWDATVQVGGLTDLVEVKNPLRPPSGRKLTPAESKLHDKMMIRIVTGLDNVAEHVSALRRKSMILVREMR